MTKPKVLALMDLPKSLSSALTQAGYTVQVIPELATLPETLVPSEPILLCDSSLWKKEAKKIEKIRKSLEPSFWIVVAQGKRTVKIPPNSLFDEYLHWPCSTEELQKRIQTGFRILSLQKKIEEAHQKIGNLKDPETGLANEYLLDSILGYELQRAKRYQLPLTCLVTSSDAKRISPFHFEECLNFFQKTIRETDYLFEIEDSKLLILMPHTERVNALSFTERIRKQTAAESSKGSVSFGIAAYPNNPVSEGRQLLQWASKALEQAKKRGGNQASLYRESES